MVWRKEIILTSGVTCAYLALFAVTFWLLMPIQAQLAKKYFTAFEMITTFVVLPHGFRVILTWLWRGRAVVLLLPGTAIQSFIIAKHYALGPPEWVAMVLSYSCCSYLAFETVKWFGLDAYATSSRPANWRVVLIVGALAGLINGVVNMAFVFNHLSMDAQMWVVLNLFVGGMVGLMVWLMVMRLVLRHMTWSALSLSSEN